MRDPAGPGMERVPSGLAGDFLTIQPPGNILNVCVYTFKTHKILYCTHIDQYLMINHDGK